MATDRAHHDSLHAPRLFESDQRSMMMLKNSCLLAKAFISTASFSLVSAKKITGSTTEGGTGGWLLALHYYFAQKVASEPLTGYTEGNWREQVCHQKLPRNHFVRCEEKPPRHRAAK